MRSPWTPLATIAVLALCSCGRQGGGFAAAPDTMPLDPETPRDEGNFHLRLDLSKIPNLEKSIQLPPIQIPVAAKVLSRGKAVTCSEKETPFEGELSYVTDGVKNGNEGYSVVVGDGPQWVQIDLGETHLIDAVVLWHYFKSGRVVNDVVVQASEDPEFRSEVITLFNNDTDNSSGQGIGNDRSYIGHYTGRQIPGKGIRARHIRTWSNGSTDNRMNEFIEVEVWGRAVK